MNLPDALQRYLADSELAVTSWRCDTGELTLKVEKDIGPETGRLAFRGVTHVNLPPALTVESIEVRTAETAPVDFWTVGTPRKSELGDSDYIFLVFESFGGRFFVVAEGIEYEILQ